MKKQRQPIKFEKIRNKMKFHRVEDFSPNTKIYNTIFTWEDQKHNEILK